MTEVLERLRQWSLEETQNSFHETVRNYYS